jgi:hypothetical protein
MLRTKDRKKKRQKDRERRGRYTDRYNWKERRKRQEVTGSDIRGKRDGDRKKEVYKVKARETKRAKRKDR